ncbi:MAG: hypothetical protein LZF63_12750 [Nitrosomonas sp.]|nr:hypothetical protein [Nitrosomonas sp.]
MKTDKFSFVLGLVKTNCIFKYATRFYHIAINHFPYLLMAAIESIGADIDFIITGEKKVYRDPSLDYECPIISKIVEQLEVVLNKNNQVLS